MARKVSDMVLLLGSRGRGRGGRSAGSRSSGSRSFGQWFGWMYRLVFGGSSSSSRSSQVSGLTVLVIAILCFGGGFMVGDHLAAGRDAAGRESAGRESSGKPLRSTLVNELDTKVLSSSSFLVAAYENLAPEQAKTRAKALADYLKAHGLTKARPYEAVRPGGSLWLVVVYYGTEVERRDFADRLRKLPADVPDEAFVDLRNRKWDNGNVWPIEWVVQ